MVVGCPNELTELTDFAVLISIASDDDLRTTGYSGHVVHADGYDIIFRASDGITQLDHEVEKYVPSTGELVAWVRIPTLSGSSDTTIYLYYGNSTITSPTENPTGVWSNGYVGVWHLAESSGDALDSTSYETNGALSGGVTQGATGKVGPAYAFDGIDSQVDMGDPSDGHLDFGTGSFTVEIWINRDSSMTTDQYGGI
ncbi:MAG: hypothetical protein AMJ46_14495, partial [Latescibacteria bacterium DG_63]